MDEKEYIKNRVCDQICWYSKKSSTSKCWFYFLSFVQIIIATALTLLSTCQGNILIAVFGGIIVVITSSLSLFSFQKLWVKYRTTSESLKKEKHLFLTKTPPYHKDSRFNLFVDNVESLISSENHIWSQLTLKKEESKQ